MAKTKYRKIYCTKAIAFMSLGKSITQFAHSINVVAPTIATWEEVYPDFAIAMDRARQASLVFWEDKLEELILDKDINTPLVKLLFAHRFRWYDSRPREDERPLELDREPLRVVIEKGNDNIPFALNENQMPNPSIH